MGVLVLQVSRRIYLKKRAGSDRVSKRVSNEDELTRSQSERSVMLELLRSKIECRDVDSQGGHDLGSRLKSRDVVVGIPI